MFLGVDITATIMFTAFHTEVTNADKRIPSNEPSDAARLEPGLISVETFW